MHYKSLVGPILYIPDISSSESPGRRSRHEPKSGKFYHVPVICDSHRLRPQIVWAICAL
jgi:hypothetical protein